jgi:hypothetical protein
MSKIRKWSEKDLIIAVRDSKSIRQVIYKLGLIPAGGNYDQIKKYISKYKLNTKHFTGKAWNKGMTGIGIKPKPLKEILVKKSTYQSYKLKQRLFNDKIKTPKCEKCGWSKRSKDGRLPLELDHINGDKYDNRITNLRILCPNCHSLEPTHRGRKIKKKNA